MAIVYLNGAFLPLEKATVSPLDRGFMFGDGVYEVIPVYRRRPFRLPEHLDRLEHSLRGIRLASPLSYDGWQSVLDELVQRNDGDDQSIYLQITRGVAARDHSFPVDCPPTVFAMSTPLPESKPAASSAGVGAITLEDIRWQHCDLKTIALLPNILLRQQAIEAGAAEAILVRDGQVTEGAASNVFCVVAGMLITPPKGPRLLPGITRDLIVELAAAHEIACREQALTTETLATADEIWLTSSTKEIVPVIRLNGTPIGDGTPGPVWSRMNRLYQDFKRQVHSGAPCP